MRNLKDKNTKIYPSPTRGGKELPSSSALDSPSVLSKLATHKPTPTIDSDMSHIVDDATSSMHDAYDETTSLLDNTVPQGEFLDEQLARVRENEITEADDIFETNKILKLNTLRHLLDLALLDMNFLLCLRVLLWMER